MVTVFNRGGLTKDDTNAKLLTPDEQMRMDRLFVKRNVYSTSTSTSKYTR